ncbi:unnamed protein product [Ascophyllum nodosum]
MQGVLIPAAKVSTDAERKKFCDMWHSHLVPGGCSLMGFPAFTLEWNTDVQQIEDGKVPFKPINRKTQSHLETYCKTHNKNRNERETLSGVPNILGLLRGPGVIEGSAWLPPGPIQPSNQQRQHCFGDPPQPGKHKA